MESLKLYPLAKDEQCNTPKFILYIHLINKLIKYCNFFIIKSINIIINLLL